MEIWSTFILNRSKRWRQTWMNERMNERLVNHSSRKFKVAHYDTERHMSISYCALSRARNACGHSASFCCELWKKVDHLVASREKRNALVISENVATSSRYHFCEYFQNIRFPRKILEILWKQSEKIQKLFRECFLQIVPVSWRCFWKIKIYYIYCTCNNYLYIFDNCVSYLKVQNYQKNILCLYIQKIFVEKNL